MKWIASLVSMSALLASAGISQAGDCAPCGGCSDPCAATTASTISAGCGCGGAMDAGIVSSGAGCGAAVANGEIIADGGESLCQPVTSYKVVMESKYVTESRPVCVTKTRTETRYRTKQVYKTVPVTETKYRSKVVNVPQTETKTINYSVLVL